MSEQQVTDLPEYPWDTFKSPAPTAHPPSSVELPDNPWDTFEPPTAHPELATLKPQDLASKIYHPVIEGAAMTAGGAAGAVIGAPAGPVGAGFGGVALSTAMYPPAKKFADAIDSIRGMASEQTTLPQDMMSGAEAEVGGRIIGPIVGKVGEATTDLLKPASIGEALSGTPKSNLSRAFKNGFVDSFFSPKTVEDAGDNYGKALTDLMGEHLTPEQQAAILINPRGEANQVINETYTKFLKGDSLTPQEAVAARQAIKTVYPPETAKNMPRIATFMNFKSHLDDILSQAAPEFKQANDDYAASKLRSALLMFGRVNKSNPEEYSKLGEMIFGALGASVGFGRNSISDAGLAFASQAAASPFAMGLVSSAIGTASRATMKALSNPLIQRAASSALDDYFQSKQNSIGGVQP